MVISRRAARFLATGVVLVVLAAACSGGGDAPESASSTSKTPPPVTCNGVNEVNQDDDGALAALLVASQLPPGAWATAQTPPCPWALSADEILAAPECRTAASAAGAAANDEKRNGNARKTLVRDDDVQLDHRVEIYTSAQNVDAIRAIQTSPAMAACYEAALQRHAAEEPGTKISDVAVTSAAVQPDLAALGVGFPASPGYDADPGFAHSIDISFTLETDGKSQPVTMRVITFGAGGLMSTVTLIGSTPAEIEAFDLGTTLQAAATSFRQITSSG